MKSYFDKAMNIAIKIREMAPLEESQRDSERKEMASLIEAMRSFMSETVSGRDALKDDIYNLDNTYTKSKQRLIKCFSEMVTTLRGCIKKAEEVLIYT